MPVAEPLNQRIDTAIHMLANNPTAGLTQALKKLADANQMNVYEDLLERIRVAHVANPSPVLRSSDLMSTGEAKHLLAAVDAGDERQLWRWAHGNPQTLTIGLLLLLGYILYGV